ncbi:MAG: hypothetical protein WAW86_09180 [Gammaproteobacteria bacterium]
MLSLFKRAWKGEASLAAAFWIIHVLIGSIVLQSIISWAISYFMPELAVSSMNVSTAADAQAAMFNKHAFMMLAICFPYTIYSAICVWRCGKNSWKLWSILSKIIVILSVISGLLSIYYLIFGMPMMPDTTSVPPAPTQAAS